MGGVARDRSRSAPSAEYHALRAHLGCHIIPNGRQRPPCLDRCEATGTMGAERPHAKHTSNGPPDMEAWPQAPLSHDLQSIVLQSGSGSEYASTISNRRFDDAAGCRSHCESASRTNRRPDPTPVPGCQTAV